jgi:hypothetical protein
MTFHKRLHIHRALITLQADPNAKARRRHKCSIPSGLGRCGVDESCALFDVDRHHSALLRGWRLRGGSSEHGRVRRWEGRSPDCGRGSRPRFVGL